MKKNILLLPLTILLLSFSSSILDEGKEMCNAYIPMVKGTVLVYEEYNSKEKLNTTETITIKDVVETTTAITITIHSLKQGKKEDDKFEGEYSYSCENGVFTMNMESLMNPETTEAFKDMEIKVEQDNLSYPATMAAGDVLPDAHLTMEIYNSGVKFMTMKFDIVNRKVDALETIATPAGSFPCVRLSYTVKMKTGFVNTEVSAIEWISPNVGIVRSETYNKKGGLEGYRILTSISL